MEGWVDQSDVRISCLIKWWLVLQFSGFWLEVCLFWCQNTDASLLPTVSWPAFAIHEEKLVFRTVDKALRKLKGKFGLKRFLRDGYGTVVEDRTRKYYRPAEIKVWHLMDQELISYIRYSYCSCSGDLFKKAYYCIILNRSEKKFGKIVLQVNSHRVSDMT